MIILIQVDKHYELGNKTKFFRKIFIMNKIALKSKLFQCFFFILFYIPNHVFYANPSITLLIVCSPLILFVDSYDKFNS